MVNIKELREAICEGCFGRQSLLNVTPQLLEEVALMSDEVINEKIASWKAERLERLDKQIADLQAKKALLEG